MSPLSLQGKTILVTGAARRVGRMLALACARAGANVIIHHGHSAEQALEVQKEIASLGHQSWLLACDLSKADEIPLLISQANEISPLYGLVNSAAIFEPLSFALTTLSDWEHHMTINLTAPFLLSQAFAKQLYLSAKSGKSSGRIVNILDWRALHPDPDHFPYTISKAALASMTKSLAVALAPQITVNGLALGAVLPPANTSASDEIIKNIPARRWSSVKEVEDALIFLLAGPEYITGEIIHVDGGRHLV